MISELNGWPGRSSVNASPTSREDRRMTRSQTGSLHLRSYGTCIRYSLPAFTGAFPDPFDLSFDLFVLIELESSCNAPGRHALLPTCGSVRGSAWCVSPSPSVETHSWRHLAEVAALDANDWASIDRPGQTPHIDPTLPPFPAPGKTALSKRNCCAPLPSFTESTRRVRSSCPPIVFNFTKKTNYCRRVPNIMIAFAISIYRDFVDHFETFSSINFSLKRNQ